MHSLILMFLQNEDIMFAWCILQAHTVHILYLCIVLEETFTTYQEKHYQIEEQTVTLNRFQQPNLNCTRPLSCYSKWKKQSHTIGLK